MPTCLATAKAALVVAGEQEHLSHCVSEAMTDGGDGAAEKVKEASDAIARLVRS
jgi:CsoR family transcriptional regulator, copper-sensing transcriptional repressor